VFRTRIQQNRTRRGPDGFGSRAPRPVQRAVWNARRRPCGAERAFAVAGGSTLADAHDGPGHDGGYGKRHSKGRGRGDGGHHNGNAILRSAPEGDARLDETLATKPPSPCLAPAVLINPAPAGAAATGTDIAASGA
jgi:hypothetical protein